jgi:cell division protein FtsI/penicillin-binding protein 2
VTLGQVAPSLAELARELASLSPRAVEAFGRGEGLTLEGGRVLAPRAADPEAEACAARARELRFYVEALVGLERRELAPLRRLLEAGQGGRSWLELTAQLRGSQPEALRAGLELSCARARDEFDELARALASEARAQQAARQAATQGPGASGGDPRAWLLELLDQRRSELEDEAADELFRAAAGFEPWRVPTETLRSTIDLGWLARALRWDPPRLEAWVASRRVRWELGLERVWLPRILVRADLEPDEDARARALLDGLAALWRPGPLRLSEPRPWDRFGDPIVLCELDSLFQAPASSARAGDASAALPFADPALVRAARAAADPWLAVGLVQAAALRGAGLAAPPAEAHAARWAELSGSGAGLDGEPAHAEALRLAHALEACFSAQVLAGCERVRGPGAAARALALDGERVDRALERLRYVLVDVQSRPARLPFTPSYDLVHFVARNAERLRGFAVRETTRRVPLVADAAGEPCAGLLIGGVRRPLLREILAQSDHERRLSELQYKLLRSEQDERELRELAARLARPDEWTGDRGLEAWFDRELRGRFGLYETSGLEPEEQSAESRLVPAIDGADLVLTIDRDLQLAAQDVLARPEAPPGAETDRLWYENPVGAIVVLGLDGEVLAAASAPAQGGLPVVPGRGRERGVARERTLYAPTFNPPGSVFKPFVAAWAVGHAGFDPARRFTCAPRARDGAPGFESLRCNGEHGTQDLHGALVRSCNSYFAQLGLACEPAELVAAARAFGFGEPTGARTPDGEGRAGLREGWRLLPDHAQDDDLVARLAVRDLRLRFPNGLGSMWATPMQVARATAGLATGELPEVRLVRSVGGVPLPRASRRVPLPEESLARVRAALDGVVEEPGGSAHGKGLSEAELGFRLACKTGSADIGAIVEVPGLSADDLADMRAGKSRKHTWLAGWFPAHAPRAVVVVYLHNVTETASRSAVHVAAQFLRQDAVRRLAERGGGE